MLPIEIRLYDRLFSVPNPVRRGVVPVRYSNPIISD